MRRLNEAISERFSTSGELVLSFWTDERAQDLTEYTLLLSFVVFASAALLVINGASMANIWGDAYTILGKANVQASGS